MHMKGVRCDGRYILALELSTVLDRSGVETWERTRRPFDLDTGRDQVHAGGLRQRLNN